ncbi:MAG TPA: glycosyltransferase family 4 protein [Gemmatimonadaceae bacterium]|jgi:glycosyltransferase involved in cell wall biosynthesis|nr:glycosyltransferase family 4 protein [Gemmatimonadaceae bacterium]
MKILWVNSNFMHPTNKGGSIRTLEMLRHLHERHEIHYAAIEQPRYAEGPARAGEYSTRSYSVREDIPERGSAAFAWQVARGLVSSLPLSMKRFESRRLGRLLDDLMRRERFDRIVCDHLTPASYLPNLSDAFLFQHNVETIIWRRHVSHAHDPVRRRYFAIQADKMFRFERRVCRTVRHIVAVSAIDAKNMRDEFDVDHISEIPTGVNIEAHAPPASVTPFADIAFVGSMDWLANIDGVTWFVREVLPLIRRRKKDCSFGIIGRSPPPAIQELAANDSRVFVTGTVTDVRPYLWGSAVSVVPLRIGGGTRLKIYESMASRVPVVSTRVGAEGLELQPPDTGRLADTPDELAAACVELLEDANERTRVAENAWQMVNERFSWRQVARRFEEILEQH